MQFHFAKPIWPEGRELERNLFVGFRAAFSLAAEQSATVRIAASTIYRVTLNGEFLSCGPARGPHGWYRVDEWKVPVGGLIEIQVAGYNINSYSLLNQPSFLQAEIVSDGVVLAATGDAMWEASILPERVQKVRRYSFQRCFSEVYRLADKQWAPIPCFVQPEKELLPRGVPYPEFVKRPPMWDIAQGEFTVGELPAEVWRDRSLTNIGLMLGGFPEDELGEVLSDELQKFVMLSRKDVNQPLFTDAPVQLGVNSYHILDLGTNLTGFLGATVACTEPTRLLLTFDEILSDGDVDFKRLDCANVISYELPPGTFELETVEPYTLRYAKLIVLEGSCKVSQLYLREYTNPAGDQAQFACSDSRLNRLFEAGRETNCQNATDIFMDCPSRERAGWLCDSFFAARVSYDLSGNTQIEHNFYENFLLPPHFDHIPAGMLPMCYPADHNDGAFIPNWALWFVLELEEFAKRTDDPEMIAALKTKTLGVLDYFRPYLNADGLLESLPGWIFVEWSAANDYVQDVSYPTNMVYAAALDAAGRLYDIPALRASAALVREAIRRLSFDGEFFTDNALRTNGNLEKTTNRTEACQYYAFFCDVATPESHPALWRTLHEDFGPARKQTGAYAEVQHANAFVGNYLRLELLSRYGLQRQMLEESVDYLLYMAERTGTLWEHDGTQASCNHGFAAHIVHTLYRDVLGVAELSTQAKTVRLKFADLPLEWCGGRMPLPDGVLSVNWWTEGDTLCYRANHPAGYALTVENDSGKTLLRKA